MDIEIIKEPKDIVFEELLNLAFEICDKCIFICRSDLITNENYEKFLESIKPHIVESKRVTSWPGSNVDVTDKEYINCNGLEAFQNYKKNCYDDSIDIEGPYVEPAIQHTLETSESVKNIIKEYSNSLYEWQSPNLPEDLHFFKNQEMWLMNIAHEKMSSIHNCTEVEFNKIKAIKKLVIEVIK